MIPLIVVLAVLLVVAIIVAISSIKIVPQSRAYVVERLGSYKETWQTGPHFLWPIFYRIAKQVSLKEQVADFPPQPVITRDNVTMQIDTVVFFQITDPKLYAYGVENPLTAIENLTATTLRNIIGDLELDHTLTSRDTINAKMRVVLDEAADAWGIRITRVEIKDLVPNPGILKAMETQMIAERERRAMVIKAEGKRKADILEAEGEKQAKILRGEGDAERIRLINDANPSQAYLTIIWTRSRL